MTEQIGQYELLEKFAEGGMAEVYFARSVGTRGFRRECAIKRLLPEHARRPELVEMFLDEARLAASLLHPNIVQVFDLGEVAGDYFMAMELVDGPHVGRLFAHSLRIAEPLPLELCAWIIVQACEGLHHAHTRVDPVSGRTLGIVHRDMSPHNVLISRWGNVKITDFGIAKMRERRSRTRTGVLKGKLGYLSPEQCLGRPLDRRSDIFALGIMLY
ncbi:MAG: serine/threonine protein kinase, partial [Myxococcales bacterium]|nr:serine/threonine protein kinase [Myxococcales bacterium]